MSIDKLNLVPQQVVESTKKIRKKERNRKKRNTTNKMNIYNMKPLIFQQPRMYSVKKVLLKILQISQEGTNVGVLFNKVACLGLQLY